MTQIIVKLDYEQAEGIRQLLGSYIEELGSQSCRAVMSEDQQWYQEILEQSAEAHDRYAELVEAMNESMSWRLWKAASGAPRGRWHVHRYKHGPGLAGESLLTEKGNVRTFATREKAEEAARKANDRERGVVRVRYEGGRRVEV